MNEAAKPSHNVTSLTLRVLDAAVPRYNIDGVVSELRRSRDVTHNVRHGGRIRPMPSRTTLSDIVDDLSAVLFPSHYGQSESGAAFFDDFVRGTLTTTLGVLEEQVRRGLSFTHDDLLLPDAIDREALAITGAFASALPLIRARLVGDLRAALDGDPAASSAPEILLGYPSMTALIHYRLAHTLHRLGARFPARLISEVARSKTAIDIHPAALIGESLFVDHGTGVVIGETAVVGNRVRLHQGVTLGAQHGPAGVAQKGLPRHPIVEDNVVIQAGATILGRITIGRGSLIGGNACVTASVPPGSRVWPTFPYCGGSEAQQSAKLGAESLSSDA